MTSSPDEITAAFSFQLDEFYLDLQEDGSRISILDRKIIEERPFPGLRPFKTSEFQLFKGRDGQAEELIKRLKKNHFLAVIGSSGTGKSSLVRAGLIPQLFGGYLQGAGNKWNIAICRPGKDPVENLAIALSSIKGHSKDKSHIYENYQSIGPQLNSSIYGILDADESLNADLPPGEKPNLLIIIDQFEELFRFDRRDMGKKNIENHFVNLLLKASLNVNSAVYVIITMRSEFLGDCVKYRGLPEAINEGQYLVPQLTRNQLKEVIEGPVNLAGKKIAPGLVELLVNEIEESKLKENLDQLPILQHALMRTYQHAMQQGTGTVISYEHYEQIGEMEHALANHAEAKYKELGEGNNDDNPSKKQQIVKVVFQALTDASTDQKGGRRPTELKNIYAIAQSVDAAEKEVDEVVNQFRDINTSFIMPPVNPNLPNTGLYPGLMMDISHESLMRNWERLNKWISEEARYGKLYKTLNERRELNEQDKSELIRGVLLRELTDWKARHLNNATWAGRYHPVLKNNQGASLPDDLYKRNLLFLEQSESANKAEIETRKKTLEKEIEISEREKWRKKVFRLFAVATIVSLFFGLWALAERGNAKKSAADALQQKELAQVSERTAREQGRLASHSSEEATRQRDSVILYVKKIQVLKELAEKSKDDAEKQRMIALQLKELAVGQNVNLQKQLVKGEIQKETFYASNLLNPADKDLIVNALFYNSLTDPEKIPLSKYVNTELLQDVNKAIEARKKILYEPVTGLRMADSVWKHMTDNVSNHNKNEIVQRILLGIFEKTIFYKQDVLIPGIVPWPNRAALLALSKDASNFALNSGNIITGTIEKNKLNINKNNVFNSTVYKDTTSGSRWETGPLALSYSNSGKLLSLLYDGKVIEYGNTTQKKIITTLPGKENIFVSEFSPDGNTLITVSRDGAMKSWNLFDMKRNKEALFTLVDEDLQNRNIKQIIFSNDNKRLIRIFNDYGFDVWNIVKKQRLTAFNAFKSPAFTTACFSPDGNYILTAFAGNVIAMLDTLGKKVTRLSLPLFSEEESYTSSPILSMGLSPDWKTLLIRKAADMFIYDMPGNSDSICHIYSTGTLENNKSVRVRKISRSQNSTVNTFFLNNDAVISMSESGHIYLWNVHENYTNLDKAFASVKQITDFTYDEKLASGRLSFEEILLDQNKDHVRAAAAYFSKLYSDETARQKSNAEKGVALYKKLSGLDNGSMKNEDVTEIVQLLEKLKTLELAKTKPGYDTVLRQLHEIVSARQVLLKTDSTNKELIHDLANNYNDLAYYKLYIKNFKGAIQDALDGLRLEPSYNIIYTNLALAYLLSGQEKEAEYIYQTYKDQDIPGISSFKEGFLKDFEDLTTAGVIPPNDQRVKKIKKDILGVKE